jgi:hypothetical protein
LIIKGIDRTYYGCNKNFLVDNVLVDNALKIIQIRIYTNHKILRIYDFFDKEFYS